VVARLIDAGAIILGTQHMAEFALSPTGLNAAYGPGRNPWSDNHVSGGSSSGAAMSVSAGHVPLAIGSDTGGSVRLPAALCGVSGLKPTQYRISSAGAMPLSPSLDCAGPIGSTVDACGCAGLVLDAQSRHFAPRCRAALVGF
jgi:aspartyl-tRNA(Asn)/glutamyl-tRNA(Gln) amidotransferase subunit A